MTRHGDPITRDLGRRFPPRVRALGRRLPTLGKLAWIVWGLVIAFITVRVILEGDSQTGVYDVFLEAANLWVAGENAYEPGTGHRYPPIATVSYLGFRALGELLGSLMWRWLNMAVYLGAVVWALRSGFPSPLAPRARAVMLLFMVLPSLTSLNNGQANGIVAAGMIAAAVAMMRARQRAAALMVTASVAYKIYPVAFAMVASVLYPRRFLPWFVLCVAICAGLPYLFAEADYVSGQYRALYELLATEDRTGDPRFAYRDLRLLLYHLGTPISDQLYLAIQVVSGGFIAALCLLGLRLGWSARRSAAYLLALTTCWMLVFGFAAEKATYILSTPILCWLLARADQKGDRRWFWFLLLIYLCYVVPIFALGPLRRTPLPRVTLPAGTLALFASIAISGVRDLVMQRRRAAR